MELPCDKKQPTFADLKEKNISWRTKHYNLTIAEELCEFLHDMEEVANNPLRYIVSEFDYQTLVDGTPLALIRYKDDEKIDKIKNKKFTLFGKLYSKYELLDLDTIINKHDKTTLYLLAEKRLTMKTGDFFILLIWATIDQPTKFTEGLDVLRKIFANGFRK